MKKLSILTICLLGACAYVDTPQEQRTVLIGAAGALVLSAAVVTLNGDDDDCPPLAPGYVGIPERCMESGATFSPY